MPKIIVIEPCISTL